MSDRVVEVLTRGVLIAGGKLLVCHTKGAANTYLPGGHIDFDEDSKTALVREIDEEMGRSASVSRFLGACDHSFMQKGQKHCEVNLVFELKIDGVVAGEDPGSREDHIEFAWLDMDTIKDSNLEPACLRACLADWINESADADRWASSAASTSPGFSAGC